MIRHSCLGLCVSLLALWTGPLLAQEIVLCPTLPVKAEGQGTTFFQRFVFCEEASPFPGITSGKLVAGGGLNVQLVTRLVAETVLREETSFVLVFVNGRPRLERRVRQVPVTIYREVLEERQVFLPEAAGRWTSIDLSLFSSWTLYHLGPDGLIVGAGATVGEELYGSALYLGVANIPNGWYQLSTAEPAGGGGEGGGEGGGGENPPP